MIKLTFLGDITYNYEKAYKAYKNLELPTEIEDKNLDILFEQAVSLYKLRLLSPQTIILGQGLTYIKHLLAEKLYIYFNNKEIINNILIHFSTNILYIPTYHCKFELPIRFERI